MGQPMGRPDMSKEGIGRPNMGRSGAGRPEITPPPQESATPEPETSSDDLSDLKKAGDAMKKLFGR
jgi:hypothetical protein